jgi:hypothetical protein
VHEESHTILVHDPSDLTQTGCNAVVSHHARLAKACCTLLYRRPQMVGLTSPPPSSSYPPPKARKARLLHPTYMGPENNGLNVGPQPPHVWTLANTYSPMAIPQDTGPILGMTTFFFFLRGGSAFKSAIRTWIHAPSVISFTHLHCENCAAMLLTQGLVIIAFLQLLR